MPAALSPVQAAHVDRLYQDLRVHGAAPDAILEWFRRVPRHHFLDQLYLPQTGPARPTRPPVRVTAATSDPAILDAIYADSALSIQVVRGVCTSSTSQPSLMAQMMADVELTAGDRVLEVGTATGWNAALMAGVVGPGGRVVSLEVDQALAATAARRLAAAEAGERVTVIARDGFDGAAEHAPFDALVVTVACPDIPRAWLDQLADGGRLVVPLALPDGSAPLLLLRRQGDHYRGRFLRWTWFVEARGRRWQPWPAPLEADRDPLLVALRGTAERRHALPWGGVGDERGLSSHCGLYLLAAAGDRVRTIRDPDATSRERRRYALVDRDPPGLAMLGEQDLLCYGSAAPGDQLRQHCDDWLAQGAPRLTDYAVEPGGAARLALRRPETALALHLPSRP